MPALKLWLLALAHWGVDLFTHMLPPVLPVLIRDLGLSVALAAALATAVNVSSGILQPFLGVVVDRSGRPWMLPLAVLWCGAFMALFGLASSYVVLFAAAVLAGLGAALFHPLASVTLRAVVGRYSAGAMSIFGLGGTVGMASAPLATAAVIAWQGLPGIRWLVLLAALVAGLLVAGGLHRLSLRRPAHTAGGSPADTPSGLPANTPSGLPANTPSGLSPTASMGSPATGGVSSGAPGTVAAAGNMRALTYLAGGKFVRTIGQTALLNFLPLYYVSRGVPESQAGLMLTVVLAVGSASAVLSGYASDRLGRKPVVVWSSVLCTPAFIGFLMTDGFLQLAFLVLTSVCFYAAFSVVPIYAQELVPDQPGMGAGLMMGGVWALASLALIPLGSLADMVDIRLALLVAAWLPLVSTGFLLLVPETRPQARPFLALSRVAK